MRSNPYETRRHLDEYLLPHYRPPKELGPFPFIPRDWLHFHQRLREKYEHGRKFQLVVPEVFTFVRA